MVAQRIEQRRPWRKRELRLDAIYDQRDRNLFWPRDCGFSRCPFSRHSHLRRSQREIRTSTRDSAVRSAIQVRVDRFSGRRAAVSTLPAAPLRTHYREDKAAMTTRMRAAQDSAASAAFRERSIMTVLCRTRLKDGSPEHEFGFKKHGPR